MFSPVQYLTAVHQYFDPNAFDFWKEAIKLGDNLVEYTDEQLQNAKATYTSATEKIDKFKLAMERLVADTKEFADKQRLEGINLDEFSQKPPSAGLNTALEKFKVGLSQPLPGDETPRQADREAVVSSALSKVEDAVVKVNALWSISEDDSRAHFKEIEPYIKSALIICGELGSNSSQERHHHY